MSDKKQTRAEQLASEGYTVKACAGCGKMMVWARKPDGNWLPLDPTPPIYSVVMVTDPNNPSRKRPEAVRNMLAFLLHHAVCPNVAQFKKGSEK